MALLTLDERKAIFSFLGLEYNEATIKAIQKKYMLRKSDWDGIWGPNTDNTVRTVYNVLRLTSNFTPEEFRCECGGKYCCGFPSYMKPNELLNIQAIRSHWNKPVTITCGLRCKGYNSKLSGAVNNSKHLTGQAVDFYQAGVTDTLANRKSAIKWIKQLPNHNYTYGNGINSNGYSVKASYMGNALHMDTKGEGVIEIPVIQPKSEPAPTPVSKTVDELAKEVLAGKWGSGDDRKKKLVEAGYDYDAVQKKVNELVAQQTTSADKIIAKAKEFAWAYGTASSKYSYSKGSAKAAYKTALKKHLGKTAKVSQSDCGYFVSTCVRAAGISSSFLALAGLKDKFPSVPSTMKVVHSGKKIPDGLLQPGDIVRYKKTNGHQHALMIYSNGKIAEAGRSNWFPAIKKDTKKYNKSNVKFATLQVIRAK